MINLKDIDHLKSRVVTAPDKWEADGRHSVFLAGTIDDGNSEDWQAGVCSALANSGLTLLNPRRPQWNPDADDATVREQIGWESDAMDRCDTILMYFAPGSKSPVTMLELGAYGSSGKIVCVCPEGFWRKQNVDMHCAKSGIETAPDLQSAIEIIKTRVA